MDEEKKVTENKIWGNLISKVLISQRIYMSLPHSDYKWLKWTLNDVFATHDDFDVESKYMCLVLLNRSAKYGRYALIYNNDMELAALKRDTDQVQLLCKNPMFPELEALSEERKGVWKAGIENEIMSLNLFFDREVLEGRGFYSSCSTNSLDKCAGEVHQFSTGVNAEYVTSNSADVVLVSEKKKGCKYMDIYKFREIDLIFLLLSGGENPYSGENLPKHTIEIFLEKYTDEMKIAKFAFVNGYEHSYML
jgi:hypothetical protein